MDITTGKIAATLIVTALLALYIFAIYRLVTRKVFYSKNFNISLAVMSLITAAIILAMQSNLVISLGMVGALSIVRFRTAIKDPMDLAFLFWSISVGIICGAGLYEVARVRPKPRVVQGHHQVTRFPREAAEPFHLLPAQSRIFARMRI